MFFNDNNNIENDLAKIAALLIHAAKIDQDFSKKEEKIILEGKKMENDSNQILDFTKKVKNLDENNKIKIIESLWKIIYSNKEADIYETSLMRRLGGLLYIDSSTMGDIKEKIKKEYS